MQMPLRVEVEYWNLLPGQHLHATLHVLNDQGILLLPPARAHPRPCLQILPPPSSQRLSYPGKFPEQRDDHIKLCGQGEFCRYFEMDEAIMFDVVDDAERKFAWYGKEPGLYPRLPGKQSTWAIWTYCRTI